MNLLEFGMKNRDSSSWVKRGLARAALETEKRRADQIERRMKKKHLDIPGGDDEKMLEEIRKRIEEK